MRIFYILIFIGITKLLSAQDAVFTATGQRVVVENQDTFVVVDVMAYSNLNFKLGSGQLYLNYDTMAFGSNVVENENLIYTIPPASILGKKIGVPPLQNNFYNAIVVNDNAFNRVSFSWQHNFSQACLDSLNVNEYLDVIFTLKFKVKQGYGGNIPTICLETGDIFIHQTYTACGPGVCDVNDCINHAGVQILNDLYPCSDCRIVINTADSGLGSLRNAIACAMPGDTIRFAFSLSGDSILLVTQTLNIDKDLSILAKKDFSISINGADIERVFDVFANQNASIEGLILIEGTETAGSAILNHGSLKLKNLQVFSLAGNLSTSQILNMGSLVIEGNVLISDN